MPGQLFGNVDCLAGTSVAAKITSHTMFKNLFDFLNSMTGSGATTRIAYNTGSFGAGTGYPGESDQFGRNSWYCFRFNTSSVRTWDWYLLVQHTSGSGQFGDSPGNPGLVNASAETQSSNEGTMAIACAAMITTGGVNANPWNGTTNNNGEDTKGDPVWNTGSVGDMLSVLPRSNNAGGSHSTSRQNMSEFYNATTTSTTVRFHFLADEDALALFVSPSNNALYSCHYVGYYEPRQELSTVDFTPLVMFIRDADQVDLLNPLQNFGSSTGNSTEWEGGVAVSSSVVIGRISRYDTGWQLDANTQPNTVLSPPQHDVFSVPIIAYESPSFGQVGYINSAIYQEMYAVDSHDSNADLSRVVLGDQATTNTTKIFTAWTGSIPGPGSGTDRTGSIF